MDLKRQRVAVRRAGNHMRAHTAASNYALKPKPQAITHKPLRPKLLTLDTQPNPTAMAVYRCSHTDRLSSDGAGQKRREPSVGNNSTTVSGCKAEWGVEIVRCNLKKRCLRLGGMVEAEDVDRILRNYPARVVAVFKEHLIHDDRNEFLHRFYDKEDAMYWVGKAAEYYSTKPVEPNYLALSEKRLLFKRERRRARVQRLKSTEKMLPAAESMLFESKFMESLLNDDLNESPSRFIDKPIESAGNEREFKELLEKLSAIVSTKHEHETPNKLAKNIRKAPLVHSKERVDKKPMIRAKSIIKCRSNCKDTARVWKQKASSKERPLSLRRSTSSRTSLRSLSKGVLTLSMKRISTMKAKEERSTPYVKISLASCNPKNPKDSLKPRLISHTHAPSMNVNGNVLGKCGMNRKDSGRLRVSEEISLKSIEKGRTSTLKLVFRKL